MRFFAVLFVSVLTAQAAMAAGPQKVTIQESKRGYTIDVSYPRFGHAAMDKVLADWAKSIAAEFREASQESTGEPQRWSAEVTYEVARQDKAFVAVAFQYHSYMGGAHPNTSTETFNFLMPEGRRVELAELISQRGIRRVSDISIARLKQDLMGADGVGDLDWIKRGAGPNARNFASFLLLPSALDITFDAYQVAAYVAGSQQVRIPLAKLKDVMRPDPRAPAASFECRNARSEVERAVCASHELARLDRQMGEAYAFKLTYEDDPAKQEAIRAGQRQWLKTRDASCRGAAIVSCLAALYQRRVKELEVP
jgi:uncharacterized protein YecT (DUF1311 family)